jgi:membrane protein implicated in regulation of membrane protease activity
MNRSSIFSTLALSPSQCRGCVDQAVTPSQTGRVYFQATYWPARLSQTSTSKELPPGAPVEIVGREGLTLLIRPIA